MKNTIMGIVAAGMERLHSAGLGPKPILVDVSEPNAIEQRIAIMAAGRNPVFVVSAPPEPEPSSLDGWAFPCISNPFKHIYGFDDNGQRRSHPRTYKGKATSNEQKRQKRARRNNRR